MLPKDYLSPSQIMLWLRSKSEYKKRYFENKPMFETIYLKYGKRVADLASGIGDPTKEEKDVLSQLPQTLFREEKVSLTIGGVLILGYIDFSDTDYLAEMKTSVNPWTQEMADSQLQITFYSYSIYKRTGHIPKSQLIWAETIKKNKSISLTGKIEFIDVAKTKEDFDDFEKLVTRVSGEISTAYKAWLSVQNGQTDLVPIEVIKTILRQEKEIKSQLSNQKEKLKSWLTENEMTNYSDDELNIYYQVRKKYEYSEMVKAKESELKELKKKEEKELVPVESHSLVLRLTQRVEGFLKMPLLKKRSGLRAGPLNWKIMNLGEAIVSIRVKRGMKQGELASSANLTQSYVSQVESNKREPSLKALKAISQSLDIPLPIMFFLALDESDIPNKKIEAFKYVRPSVKAFIAEFFTNETD